MQSRGNHTTLYAIGRLKREVDVASARAEMQNIVGALALEYPETNKSRSSIYLVPLAERVVGEVAPTLTVLAGAVALLLLIAHSAADASIDGIRGRAHQGHGDQLRARNSHPRRRSIGSRRT